MEPEDGEKLKKLRPLSKSIAIGFMVLKLIYVGKDVNGGKRARAKEHYSIISGPFDTYVQSSGKKFYWIYFIPKEWTELYATFETIMLSCFKQLDRPSLLNDLAGENLANMIKNDLQLGKRMSIFSFLLEVASAAPIEVISRVRRK